MKCIKGFTLVELMVSIAIIVLLTGIVVANLSTTKSHARDAKRVSDIAQLQGALEFYFDRCGQYPTVDSANMPNIASGAGVCPSTITLETFISKIPTAPSQGEPYTYGLNTTKTDYVLKAVLENNNPVLNDTRHTTILGVDCTADKAYCVQPR